MTAELDHVEVAVSDRDYDPARAVSSRNPPMKVINCVSRAHFGGTPWRVAVIALALRSSGVDTTVLLPSDRDAGFREFLEFHDISHIERPLRTAARMGRWGNNLRFLIGFPAQIHSLARLFRERGADMIHVNGAANVAPLIAAILSDRPVLWHWNDMLVPRWIAAVLKLLLLSRQVHAVVASSPVAVRYGLHRGMRRYLGILPPPLPPDFLVPSLIEPLPTLPEDRKVLGFVSNLLETKGAMEFVETVAALRRRSVIVSGIMVGAVLSGHEAFHEKLLRRIRELQIADQITLIGYRYDVMNVMRCFDVLLYPSHTEAAPIVIVQALAVGLPIVATAVGDIPGMLEGLGMPVVPVGHVEAMADAVQRALARTQASRESSRQAAKLRVAEQYSTARIASRHLELYDALAGEEKIKILNIFPNTDENINRP